MTYLCVLDFEATCWNQERNDSIREIIEFPSVLYKVNTHGKVKIEFISEFSQFVKPVINPILSSFCTELTGITQKQVDESNVISIVYEQHNKWLYDNVPNGSKLILITCGYWDLSVMLPLEINRYNLTKHYRYTQYSNIKNDFERFYNKKAGSMINMLTKLNLDIIGKHHSGIDDCRNIMRIVIRMIDDGFKCNFLLNKIKD